MKPMVTAATLALILGGCASILGPRGAPTCDGMSRRPLNRSMWDWDRAAPSAATLRLSASGRRRSPSHGLEPLRRREPDRALRLAAPARLPASPLRPQPSPARGRPIMVETGDLKVYFERARSWEQDLLLQAHRSRRLAWTVAGRLLRPFDRLGGRRCGHGAAQDR